MGWLPIVLALVAFAFLLTVVNYNNIKSRRDAIQLAFFNLCQTATARNALLQKMQGVQTNTPCPFSKSKLDSTFNNHDKILSFSRNESKSVKETSKLLIQEFLDPRSAKAFIALNHRQKINIQILERKIREYNKLINHQPTKMVARLTGFQRF